MLLAGQFGVRVLGVVSLAVLARLLSPADYGVVALAFIAVELAKKFSEMHINNALIRETTIEADCYDTAFTLSLMRGALVAAALLLVAAPVAALMNEPAVAPVLRWMALIPLIEGLRSPRMVDLARRLDFSREAAISIATKLVFIATAIALALAWGDYWALVVGMIVSSVAGLALAHRVAPYRPRLSLAQWRLFVGFGGWLTLSTIFSFGAAKMGAILVGWRLGAESLGQYHVGDQLATMATNQLATPFTRAIYSGLARVGADRTRLVSAFRRAQAMTLAAVLPVGAAMAMVAPELVMILAGPQWGEAVLVVQIVAPVIALTMVATGAQALLMTLGDTRSIFLCNLANFLFRLPVLIPAVVWFGFEGLLWGRVLTGTFFLWSMLWLVRRGAGEAIWKPFALAWRSVAAAAAMAAALGVVTALQVDPGTAVAA
ncbi:oligosaccharide flippase family protein, partial [Rubrimonas sp.]|uniref:oligosaccharide flippase family protein n=1 Tax=Rubrimonas sp. TaxID=2036015 RepID=UPI002FDD7306